MNYYQRLRDIREDNDLTQAQVLNIKQTQYSRYERGAVQMSIDKYIILARYYNISLDYITGIIDESKKILNNKKREK